MNSVALYLLMVEQGIEFEAVFSNTGCEWPETYHYLAMFQWWTKANGLRSVTILNPVVDGTRSLLENCEKYSMVPQRKPRWCTSRWKSKPLEAYQKKPAFVHIGFAFDEAHRATLRQSVEGYESRYLLIEHKITRGGCVEMIRKAGLPIPRKSGCFVCPMQRRGQWQELRRYHPDLFCKALHIERLSLEYRKRNGKKPMYLSILRSPLSEIVSERQIRFEADEYPPCLCGL